MSTDVRLFVLPLQKGAFSDRIKCVSIVLRMGETMKLFFCLLVVLAPVVANATTTVMASQKYVDEKTVDIASDQTIGGVKTFETAPIVPTPLLPAVE